MTLVRHYTDKEGRVKTYTYDTIVGGEYPLERRKQYDARYRQKRRQQARKAASPRRQRPTPRKTMVDSLTERQRSMIRDVHGVGLSMQKTAAAVGTSRHAVRSALERDGLV